MAHNSDTSTMKTISRKKHYLENDSVIAHAIIMLNTFHWFHYESRNNLHELSCSELQHDNKHKIPAVYFQIS